MTRLARNPSATQQANRGTAVHARWRVGARGMLALAIHDVENGTAEVTLTPDASARETLPGRLSTHGAVDARGLHQFVGEMIGDDNAAPAPSGRTDLT